LTGFLLLSILKITGKFMSIETNSDKTLKYISIALRILEKTLHSKFRVTGQENLPSGPIVFVANHFTRSETFFIPYVINKYSKRQVRCLADASLYKGLLGKFLTSTGTISTKQKGRDGIILKDLILGDNDWVIYPEGSMVKSKEIKKDKTGDFVNYTPYRVGKTRTGATVLALKSELYRSELIEAFEKKSLEILDGFKKAFNLEYQVEIQDLQTHIVPLNITYYPIRPGENRLKSLINRLVKKIPPQISEEIEIETNLLLSADINIYFGQAINLGDYIKTTRQSIYKIPIIKNETKSNFVLKYLKNRLTNQYMATIYYNAQINIDHIFSAILFYLKTHEIEIDCLKRLIYLSAIMIKKIGKYRVHDSIWEENLFKIFLQESHKEFDSIFNLASDLEIITIIPGNKIRIDQQKLGRESDFYKIRLENTLHVILNEFFLLDVANDIIRRNVSISDQDAIIKVRSEIFKADLEIFEADYQQYFDQEFSTDKSLGSPFILESPKNSGQNPALG
jgi:1-acyl-sn-glycerol-3-phosphate acyltransferase